jgi:hypothetical protein
MIAALVALVTERFQAAGVRGPSLDEETRR